MENNIQKIKIAEFISRLEFGGAESMLLNYTTHFKNPNQFDFHIITQDINDINCIRQFEDAGYTVHVRFEPKLLKALQETKRKN